MSLAASYVHRCFLSDIPATIERQWTKTNTSKSPSNLHQRRLHSKDASSDSLFATRSSATATPKEPVYLRLLGTVVEVLNQEHANDSNVGAASNDNSSKNNNNQNSNDPNTTIIVIDDGTGSLAQIQVPSEMATRIQVQPGMTLECIARAILRIAAAGPGDATTSSNNNQPYILLAHQLVVVQDPHAETLRWLELTYRKAATLPSVQSVEQFGYPCSCNNSMISAEELYYIILSDCETEKSNNDSGGSNNNNNNRNKIRGVSLQDLSEGLEIAESLLEGLIEDLQLAGQIYCNEDGNYLPL